MSFFFCAVVWGVLNFQSVEGSTLASNLANGVSQTMLVYGTSLTAGGPWVGQVQGWLSTNYPGSLFVVNSGMGGKASNTGLANLQTWVINYQPNTVFIEFAVNDAYTGYGEGTLDYGISVAQSKSNLNVMLDRIWAANPQTEIILQTMNSVWDAPNGYFSATLRAHLAEYYQGYRDVAQQRGVLLVDHYPNWVSLQTTNPALFQSYVADGVHPGATACETIMMPLLRSLLTNGVSVASNPPSVRSSPFMVQPGQATASSYYSPDGRAPPNAINGSGLSAPLLTGAPVPAVYPRHDPDYRTTWLSAAGGSGSSWIQFDLTETNQILGFHLWNYNESHASYDTPGRGMTSAVVWVSRDGHIYQNLGPFTFAKAGSISPQTNYVGESYLFPIPQTTRFVMFSNALNFGVDTFVGISEIRFIGDNREPDRSTILWVW